MKTARQTPSGTGFRARGQMTQAETAYRAALHIDPDHVYARYRLAETLKAQGRAPEALTEFEGAMRRDKQSL